MLKGNHYRAGYMTYFSMRGFYNCITRYDEASVLSIVQVMYTTPTTRVLTGRWKPAWTNKFFNTFDAEVGEFRIKSMIFFYFVHITSIYNEAPLAESSCREQ